MAIDVEQYYKKYGPMVLRRCRRLLGNEPRAVEAMQDTFVALIENQGRLVDQAPSSLLYRMATNICLNRIRSEKHMAVGVEPAVLELALKMDPGDRWQSRNWITKLFASEQEKTVYIAILFHLDGCSLEETAGEVGMSVSGVRKRLKKLEGVALKLREQEA